MERKLTYYTRGYMYVGHVILKLLFMNFAWAIYLYTLYIEYFSENEYRTILQVFHHFTEFAFGFDIIFFNLFYAVVFPIFAIANRSAPSNHSYHVINTFFCTDSATWRFSPTVFQSCYFHRLTVKPFGLDVEKNGALVGRRTTDNINFVIILIL